MNNKNIKTKSKKMLIGGLLTKGIKTAYKAYKQSGGKKITDIVKLSKVSRSTAKADVKSGLSNRLKSKRNFTSIKTDQNKNPKTIADLDKLKKYRKEKKDLTQDINKLKIRVK